MIARSIEHRIDELRFGHARILAPEEAVSHLGSLSEWERELCEGMRSEPRRAEFVAGRLAAREALAALLGADAVVPLSIQRHDDGAPRLEGLSEVVSLSISHGRARAIAVAARGGLRLGIDLCEAGDAARIRRVQDRAFPKASERALLFDDEPRLRAGWALKEAVAKALRIGLLYDAGFERIELLSLDPPQVRVDEGAIALLLRVREVDDGLEALALAPEP